MGGLEIVRAKWAPRHGGGLGDKIEKLSAHNREWLDAILDVMLTMQARRAFAGVLVRFEGGQVDSARPDGVAKTPDELRASLGL